MYVVELNRHESEFWGSTLAKIFTMIDMHLELKYKNKDSQEEETVTSMKDIPGFF